VRDLVKLDLHAWSRTVRRVCLAPARSCFAGAGAAALYGSRRRASSETTVPPFSQRCGTFPLLSRTSVLAAPLLVLLDDRCLQARFHPAKRWGSSSWRATRLPSGDVSHSSPSSTKTPPPSQASSTSSHPAPAGVPPPKPTYAALSSSSLYARAPAPALWRYRVPCPCRPASVLRDATGAG
jgi:hypothetical protein